MKQATSVLNCSIDSLDACLMLLKWLSFYMFHDCFRMFLQARSWSLEGSLKLKNLFGYGEIWDASGAYGWDQASEISAGLSLPRLKAISTPLVARVLVLSQDWLKFSSYKERLLGLSFGLLSTARHNLAYNLTWRTLTDPTGMASKSVRRLLGHSLLSSIKYTYKIDHRDSHLRPTCGYAFLSSSQVGGLGPDSKSLRFIRQVQCSIFHHFQNEVPWINLIS